MLSRRRRLSHALVAILAAMKLILVRPDLAESQVIRDPLSSETRDPLLMAAQFRAGLELTEMALAQFQRPDAFETFAIGFRLASRAYAQIRVAISSMVSTQSASKYPNPMLELQIKYTNEAWKHVRLVVDSHYGSQGTFARPEQIPIDVANLSDAVRILRKVATTLP